MGVGKLPGVGSEGGWPSSPNSGNQPSEIVSKSMTQGGGIGSEGGYKFVPSPQYHNTDPLVHLIGPANESPAEVKGVKITSLVDSGACMSAMVKRFAEELNLEIQPLSTILDIESNIMAHLLRMGSMTMNENSDKSEFNLDEIQGSVHLTQNITLGPFENVTISGLLKGPVKSNLYNKRVNVSVEPLEGHKEDGAKYCAVPGYTFRNLAHTEFM